MHTDNFICSYFYKDTLFPNIMDTKRRTTAGTVIWCNHSGLCLCYDRCLTCLSYCRSTTTNHSFTHIKKILVQLWVCNQDQKNLPKVIYPIFSPTLASVFCNSRGGSRWLKRTCGAVWLARLPSLNSCINTLPITMSSSSLKIVLNTTVTRSAFASTYL